MVFVEGVGGVAGAVVAAGGLFAAVFAGASGHGWVGWVGGVKWWRSSLAGPVPRDAGGCMHVKREGFSVVVAFLGERGSSVFISGGWLQEGSGVVKGSLRRIGDGSTGLVVNSFIHDTAVMEGRGVRHRSRRD